MRRGAPTTLILLAGLGSLGLLLAAWGFEYIGGLAPCPMCLWQRYPHMVSVGIALAALCVPHRAWPALGATAALSSAGVALYHTGVERNWWDGPATCAAPSIEGLTAEELFDQIMAAPVVRCDEVAWELLGLSMASWNGLASLALGLVWVLALTRKGDP